MAETPTPFATDPRVPRGDVWTIHNLGGLKVCHPGDLPLMRQRARKLGLKLVPAPEKQMQAARVAITTQLASARPVVQLPRNPQMPLELLGMIPMACAVSSGAVKPVPGQPPPGSVPILVQGEPLPEDIAAKLLELQAADPAGNWQSLGPAGPENGEA